MSPSPSDLEADGSPFPRELSPGRQRRGNGSGVVNRVVSRACCKDREGPGLDGVHGKPPLSVRTDRPDGLIGAPRARGCEFFFLVSESGHCTSEVEAIKLDVEILATRQIARP